MMDVYDSLCVCVCVFLKYYLDRRQKIVKKRAVDWG